jgi:hypothetical protein
MKPATTLCWLVRSLFNDALSVTRLYSVDDSMISEWWLIDKYLVGSGRSIILSTILAFACRDWEKSQNFNHDRWSLPPSIESEASDYEAGMITTRPLSGSQVLEISFDAKWLVSALYTVLITLQLSFQAELNHILNVTCWMTIVSAWDRTSLLVGLSESFDGWIRSLPADIIPPCLYVTCGMGNRSVGCSSSET